MRTLHAISVVVQNMTQPFDVIIAADFRFPGGTSSAVAAEIRALRLGGHSVGLCQMDSPILRSVRQWNERILALVEGGDAIVLASNATACCRVLLAHRPWLFAQRQAERPKVESKVRILVAHHSPTDATGRLNYDPDAIDRHAAEAFGGGLVWAPISPVCRDSFSAAGMTQPRLRDDWSNVVFVDDWGASRTRFVGDHPVIGRHSRPQLEKWPPSRAETLMAYPDDMEVRLLGVGEQARGLLDPLPPYWKVWEFNDLSVRDFLAGIDFFVYFHNPTWIETFGLTIAEAASAGCVAITHPYLERTFGDAALYCEPNQAPALIRSIVHDPERFALLSARGRERIDESFGPGGYLRRFRRLLAACENPELLNDLIIQPEGDSRLWLRKSLKRSAYWWRKGGTPGLHRVLQSKAIRRPVRKFKKALNLR